MIRFVEGNLIDADVEAVVNTVNTVGVMGKGIAHPIQGSFFGELRGVPGRM